MNKNLLTIGCEPRIFCVVFDCSTNCATTTALIFVWIYGVHVRQQYDRTHSMNHIAKLSWFDLTNLIESTKCLYYHVWANCRLAKSHCAKLTKLMLLSWSPPKLVRKFQSLETGRNVSGNPSSFSLAGHGHRHLHIPRKTGILSHQTPGEAFSDLFEFAL